MKKLFSVTNYALIGIHVLLLFLLLFEGSVVIPFWLNPVGRMHPLLLHLPIGFLFLVVLFWFFRKEFSRESFQKVTRFMLALTALSIAFAALMGFFLSTESGYTGVTLTRHKWSGVALSLVCYVLYTFYDKIIQYKNAYPAFLGISSLLIIFTGHLGGNLTHGEEFLFEAFNTPQEKAPFTVENTLYEAVVFPIFEAKCVACHNDNKIKGELNMSSVAKILKGGKNGAIWVAGEAENSHFIQRANLPLDDKKHMPPRGKTQLTEAEIVILTAWVNSGAATDLPVKDYADSLQIKQLALSQLQTDGQVSTKIYDFEKVSSETIAEVNTPFCTVTPLATNSPALSASFYVAQRFDTETLKNLTKVSEQLVSLNLSKMPLKDADLKLVSGFENLEKLILNATDITGDNLSELTKLTNLTSLAVANTGVDASELKALLKKLPNLKEVFVWGTELTTDNISELSKQYKKITFDQGYISDDDEMIVLNPPIIDNEETVIVGEIPISFSHPLPNVTIRYTTDGSDPDSVTGFVYSKPFVIDDFTMLKAVATKSGWYTSDVVQQSYYKSNFKAHSVALLTPPNPQYKGSGATSLTDLKLGDKTNIKDTKWLGYQDTNLETVVGFPQKTPKAITLNYLVNVGQYIMPPTEVEVWGSNDEKSWKIINKAEPQATKPGTLNQTVGINMALNNASYKYLKIVAKPLKKLPSWHPGAGEPAWVFVDEIFFN